MKKIFSFMIILTLMSSSVFAVELTYIQNAMFRICGDPGNYIQGIITKASALDLNYRAQADIIVMKDYIKILLGQPDQIGLVFPDEVYSLFLSKFDGDSFHYGTLIVDSDHAAPTGCVVSGSDIACDEPVNTLHLFKWNNATKMFSDTEDVAACVGGTCTFSFPGSGSYVVGFTGDSFCTMALTL